MYVYVEISPRARPHLAFLRDKAVEIRGIISARARRAARSALLAPRF